MVSTLACMPPLNRQVGGIWHSVLVEAGSTACRMAEQNGTSRLKREGPLGVLVLRKVSWCWSGSRVGPAAFDWLSGGSSRRSSRGCGGGAWGGRGAPRSAAPSRTRTSPLVERQVAGDDHRAALVAPAEDLE